MAAIVEFRTGVEDPVSYAAGWLRVAAARGARARVIGPMDRLQALDRMLWTDDPGDFVPHAWAHRAKQVPGLVRTPLWLGDGELPVAEPGLLLNLGADVRPGVEAMERIIEVVGTAPDEVHGGRQRWRAYVQLGLTPAHRQAHG